MSVVCDKKAWDVLKKKLAVGNDLELRVGFFENARYGPENDNLQVAQVAKWNEEGTTTNPTRPFMRHLVSSLDGVYTSTFAASIQSILIGKSSFSKEYKKLGPLLVEDMQEVIAEWSTPPNSPTTVAKKGFNNPLVDTGLMHDSVEFRVKGENK